MVINHFPSSSFEDRLNAFLRVYEIVVVGGKYYERENQSNTGRTEKDSEKQEEKKKN